ncbi:TetR family transcriptional regulator [Caballeronia udeis]|uniref:TetR family transcriptional regulator n=1 Tax=Caballeronia udeis TaxID=1232866 RepID=A0A158IV86_9BURK|nr:CerR family C-terminal domain-containing protein [Caballeronia udeis]SAL60507.1 TetR family transcriptional regulator [Caballeronia udeis]
MNDTKRLRRPSAGGYVRGDETRLRIIEAAIESFGEHGFEGASTRDIAARAGVNAPALQYYFENKEGVYRACAEYLADSSWITLEPVVKHAADVLSNDSDIPVLIDAFIRIQEAIADRMFMKACDTSNQRLFFTREQAGHEPSIASEIMMRRVRQPLNDVGSRLIARITGAEPDDQLTLIRMLSLHGQLLMFHVAPRTTLAMLGWKEIDTEKGDLLKATVRTQTQMLLEQWSRDGLANKGESGGNKKPAAKSAPRKRTALKSAKAAAKK